MEDDKKNVKTDIAERINITVESQDRTIAPLTFKLKITTPMKKLIVEYHSIHHRELGTFRFFNDEGQRILPEMTPEKLGLKDGVVIMAMVEQEGGSL